jgi:hypothetical protein
MVKTMRPLGLSSAMAVGDQRPAGSRTGFAFASMRTEAGKPRSVTTTEPTRIS